MKEAVSDWHIHNTWALTYWRRRRWWGWQTRQMTNEELRAHFAKEWLGDG